MGTVNSDVKKMDGPQETIQGGTPEAPQCVQVGPEELVKKHIYIYIYIYMPLGVLSTQGITEQRLNIPFHLSLWKM